MKAKGIFINNIEEIEQAEKMNMNVPASTYDYDDIYFKISEVSIFLKNNNGGINISIYGETWTLAWNQDVWDKLVKEFE